MDKYTLTEDALNQFQEKKKRLLKRLRSDIHEFHACDVEKDSLFLENNILSTLNLLRSYEDSIVCLSKFLENGGVYVYDLFFEIEHSKAFQAFRYHLSKINEGNDKTNSRIQATLKLYTEILSPCDLTLNKLDPTLQYNSQSTKLKKILREKLKKFPFDSLKECVAHNSKNNKALSKKDLISKMLDDDHLRINLPPQYHQLSKEELCKLLF